RFLAFLATVINCAAGIKGESERIKMALDAARRFLNAVDTSGEDPDVTEGRVRVRERTVAWDCKQFKL
ncbi:MAG: hypothetical protein ACRC4H_01145, partial [Plesiomonas sp.]